MSTHIEAKVGEIADRVLLPGDPMRAKFIAENFLVNAVCYNRVRGMYGFTGTYKGKKVSVQGTGMGIPSIGIYAYELINFYGVKRLIRTGTCGSMDSSLFNLRDVIIAQAAASDSGTQLTRFPSGISFPATADFSLIRDAAANAEKLGINAKVGTVFSSDLFYTENENSMKEVLKYGVACEEMECAELFMLGARHKVQTLGILTVSDLIFEEKNCTSQEREQTFTQMMELALETI